MSKYKFEYDKAGFNALRKSPEAFAMIMEEAKKKRRQLGDGYEDETRQSGTRVVAKVYPVSPKAKRDTFENNSLLK